MHSRRFYRWWQKLNVLHRVRYDWKDRRGKIDKERKLKEIAKKEVE